MTAAIYTTPEMLGTIKEFFRYPDDEQMAGNKIGILNLLEYTSSIEGTEELRQMLMLDQIDLEELQIDYTALFVNGFPRAKAHPFAGWYLGDDIVFGSSALDILELYSRYGLSLEPDHTLPADHLLVELEFMAIMAEQYAKTADSSYLHAMRDMMNHHMNQWIFKFLLSIKNHADSRYFKTMAEVLTLFFNEVNRELREVA